jgi:tripartite-type tricarboxylate transporter receptor subunit TctC
VRIITAPAFAARLEVAGYEVHASSPAELLDFAAAETARWGELIRTLDVHLE